MNSLPPGRAGEVGWETWLMLESGLPPLEGMTLPPKPLLLRVP